jgi:hypothetical protein
VNIEPEGLLIFYHSGLGHELVFPKSTLQKGVIRMHAYSELFAERFGIPKHQLAHELTMLVLEKVIKGDEPEADIYARYEGLRKAFSDAIDD